MSAIIMKETSSKGCHLLNDFVHVILVFMCDGIKATALCSGLEIVPVPRMMLLTEDIFFLKTLNVNPRRLKLDTRAGELNWTLERLDGFFIAAVTLNKRIICCQTIKRRVNNRWLY